MEALAVIFPVAIAVLLIVGQGRRDWHARSIRKGRRRG